MKGELTTRRLLAMVAAGFVIIIGALGLWQPVHLSAYDQYGVQIRCGTGIMTDLSYAQIADGGNAGAHTDECRNALLVRRAWTIPLMVVGAGVLVTLALRGTRVVSPQSRQ